MHIKTIVGFIVVLCSILISTINCASEDNDNNVVKTDTIIHELDDDMDDRFRLRKLFDMMVEQRVCRQNGQSCRRKKNQNCSDHFRCIVNPRQKPNSN